MIRARAGAGLRSAQRRLYRRLTARSYSAAKRCDMMVLRLQHRRSATPVVVYQMGKVGSQTIVHSLGRADLDRPIFHVHFLTAEGILSADAIYRRAWNGSRRGGHVWVSEYLRRQLDEGRAGRWDVVTLVRDPIARNLSSFFQVGELQFGQDHRAAMVDPDRPRVLRDLTRAFLRDFDEHDVPLTWFDQELRAVFGLDVYASDFPTERGFGIYEGARARVLVLKLEALRGCARAAFHDFLGLPSFVLTDDNLGEQKAYGDLYRDFVRNVALPDTYIDRMYGSRYAQHFYSPDELDAFARRWRRTRSVGQDPPAATVSAGRTHTPGR